VSIVLASWFASPFRSVYDPSRQDALIQPPKGAPLTPTKAADYIRKPYPKFSALAREALTRTKR
jgi:hypothetical protein